MNKPTLLRCSAIAAVIGGAFPRFVPALWITSLIFGVTGLGFIAAGVHLFSDASSGAD